MIPDLFSNDLGGSDEPLGDQPTTLEPVQSPDRPLPAKLGAQAAPKRPDKALKSSDTFGPTKPLTPTSELSDVGEINVPPAIRMTLQLYPDDQIDPKRLHQIRLSASHLDPRGYGDWVEVVQIADLDLRSQELSIRAEQILKLASEAGMRRYVGLPDLEECQTVWLHTKNDYSHALLIEEQIKDTKLPLPELQAATVAKLKDQGLGRSAIETMGLHSALPEYAAIHQLIASLQNRRQSQISDYRRRKEREAMATSPPIVDAEVA